MKRINEMNKLEKEGTLAILKREGWTVCTIGQDNIRGWTRGSVTIKQEDAWITE